MADPSDPLPPPARPAQSPPKPSGMVDPARALLAQARAAARARGRTGGVARRTTRADTATRSGSSPDDRDPQTLAAATSRLLAQHGWEVEVAVHSVMARWAQIVGPQVAAHCQPERFSDGQLTVRTDSTSWATQIRLLAPQLLRRLNVELGDETVRLVIVRGPDAPRWRYGPRAVRGRGPRDTYG